MQLLLNFARILVLSKIIPGARLLLDIAEGLRLFSNINLLDCELPEDRLKY